MFVGYSDWEHFYDSHANGCFLSRSSGFSFGQIVRHPNESQSLFVLIDKTLGFARSMHWMLVGDQIDSPIELFKQALHEPHENGRFELAPKHHEGKCAFVGTRRDHFAAEAMAGGLYHGRFTGGDKTCPYDVITAQPHFITPIDCRFFLLGLPGNHWVGMCQQAPNPRLVSPVGARNGFLRAHALGVEVAPHCHERYLDAEFAMNQTRHGGTRPEIKWQLQLIRHCIDDLLSNTLRWFAA